MYNLPEKLTRAELIRRVNRFVAEVYLNGKIESVYVPNTGRLSELALPGAEVLLSPVQGKFRYKILYIINHGYPVMIDSTYSNRLFHDLIIKKRVPGLSDYTLIKREPAYGNHRFDFLFDNNGKETLLELKSCTLFHNTVASFPDAVSERASEHIKLLAERGNGNIVFLVLKEGMKYFIPNYHTDFTFYETLKNFRKKINIKALSVQYNSELEITGLTEIPVIIPEVKPSGLFLILMEYRGARAESASDRYKLLCGRDETDIFRKVRKLKTGISKFKIDSGMDFSRMKIITDLPVVTEKNDLEIFDRLFVRGVTADGSRKGAEGEIVYTSADWRIYSFKENPAREKWFWDEVLKLRFNYDDFT